MHSDIHVSKTVKCHFWCYILCKLVVKKSTLKVSFIAWNITKMELSFVHTICMIDMVSIMITYIWFTEIVKFCRLRRIIVQNLTWQLIWNGFTDYLGSILHAYIYSLTLGKAVYTHHIIKRLHPLCCSSMPNIV